MGLQEKTRDSYQEQHLCTTIRTHANFPAIAPFITEHCYSQWHNPDFHAFAALKQREGKWEP